MVFSENNQFQLDKSSVSVFSLNEPSDEKAYWLSVTPDKRLEALEMMRQLNYGYDPNTTRFQRVFDVTQLRKG